MSLQISSPAGKVLTYFTWVWRSQWQNNSRKGRVWDLPTVPGVAVSAKNEGGAPLPRFWQHQEYSATPAIPSDFTEVPIAKIRIAERVCFYLPGTLKFAPNQHPLPPQPCRAIVIPRGFFATKFPSAHIWNLPQKFPLIFLTSLSLQPGEVQREKKHALTTAQYVFPTCCAGPVPSGQEANAPKFCLS